MQPDHPPVWSRSDRPLARIVAQPLRRFLAVEAAGGIVLVAATVVALVWANSPWSDAYDDLWHTRVGIEVGGWSLAMDLRHWVDDGLMALFFFVVGLEIKQELVNGHLADRRRAVLPAVAALGGMVVPAVLFVAVNAGGDGVHGWGVPMATDIAFALGVLALAGPRVPSGLKVLLLALAIVDDLGAIAVIALFYAERIEPAWLLGALGVLLVVSGLRRARVWYLPIYAVVGVGVWYCTYRSGVHATLAGVALGVLAPARALLPAGEGSEGPAADVGPNPTAGEVRHSGFFLRESVPVTERLAEALHPWTSYVVVPVFALANAGIELSGDAVGDAATSPITLGVVVGLVVGKCVGIVGAVGLARRLGWASLPEGVDMRQVTALGLLGGIGFTVSLFVAGLAYDDAGSADQARIGILVASAVAAAAGLVALRAAVSDSPRSDR